VILLRCRWGYRICMGTYQHIRQGRPWKWSTYAGYNMYLSCWPYTDSVYHMRTMKFVQVLWHQSWTSALQTTRFDAMFPKYQLMSYAKDFITVSPPFQIIFTTTLKRKWKCRCHHWSNVTSRKLSRINHTAFLGRSSLSLSYTASVLFLPIHLASKSPKPR